MNWFLYIATGGPFEGSWLKPPREVETSAKALERGGTELTLRARPSNLEVPGELVGPLWTLAACLHCILAISAARGWGQAPENELVPPGWKSTHVVHLATLRLPFTQPSAPALKFRKDSLVYFIFINSLNLRHQSLVIYVLNNLSFPEVQQL